MLDLATPLNLWALTAIGVPLVIHLWKRRNPRKIKLGSLMFLQGSRPSRFRSLSVSNLPLLAARVLILAALALLLSKPFLKLPSYWAGGSSGKRWVLVCPDLLRDWQIGSEYYELEERQFEQSINSLVADGWELRLFTRGFPGFNLARDVVALPSSSNYWSLLAAADRQAPGSTFFVLAPELASRISGRRPAITSQVHWELIPRQGTGHWIAKAVAGHDTLHLTVGSGTHDHTRYSHHAFTGDGKPLKTRQVRSEPRIQVSQTRDSWTVGLGASAGSTTKIQVTRTDPLATVVFYGPERLEDAIYVHSALRAIADSGIVPMTVALAPIARPEERRRQAEVAFWLSEEPPQEQVLEWVRQGSTLISDATRVSRGFSETPATVEFGNQRERLRLWRRSETLWEGLQLWEDGEGHPLLTMREEGLGIWLHYSSCFHPTWSDLVLKPSFPEVVHWMMNIRSGRASGGEKELRGADPRQFSPKREEFAGRRRFDFSLDLPIWGLAAVLFIIERFLAERRRA